MSLQAHNNGGQKMKYEDCKNMVFDLSSIGGNRPYTLDDLVREVVCCRSSRFFKGLFDAVKSENGFVGNMTFDAIGFLAATKDFDSYLSDEGYEGELLYDVIAGSDWVWHCKTTITWRSALPIAGGFLYYHTDLVPGENVNPNSIAAMTGTSMEIKIIKNDLKPITFMDALKREGIIK